ncbi:unnamed protein product, partial [Closterium sp. Naga37s-1]
MEDGDYEDELDECGFGYNDDFDDEEARINLPSIRAPNLRFLFLRCVTRPHWLHCSRTTPPWRSTVWWTTPSTGTGRASLVSAFPASIPASLMSRKITATALRSPPGASAASGAASGAAPGGAVAARSSAGSAAANPGLRSGRGGRGRAVAARASGGGGAGGGESEAVGGAGGGMVLAAVLVACIGAFAFGYHISSRTPQPAHRYSPPSPCLIVPCAPTPSRFAASQAGWLGGECIAAHSSVWGALGRLARGLCGAANHLPPALAAPRTRECSQCHSIIGATDAGGACAHRAGLWRHLLCCPRLHLRDSASIGAGSPGLAEPAGHLCRHPRCSACRPAPRCQSRL